LCSPKSVKNKRIINPPDTETLKTKQEYMHNNMEIRCHLQLTNHFSFVSNSQNICSHFTDLPSFLKALALLSMALPMHNVFQ